MKKLTAFVLGLSFLFPPVASAASFVVSPASGSYTAGNTVTLQVSVNPAGATIYTAMLDARFSTDTFEVVSFTLNDALLPLKQSGYDALNNTTGVLTKTGGFTGITSTASFGTVVLRAKASGSGTFTITDSSKLLDGSNADQQNGVQTMNYNIASAPATKQIQDTTIEKSQTTKTGAVSGAKKVATTTEATSSQAAAVATAGMGMGTWALVILVIIAAFATGYFVGIKKQVLSDY